MKIFLPACMAAVLVAAWIFSLAACESEKEKEAENAVKAPPRVAVVDGEPVIKLTALEKTRAGLATALLSGESVPAEVQAYGTVVSLQDFPALQARFAEARAGLEKIAGRPEGFPGRI